MISTNFKGLRKLLNFVWLSSRSDFYRNLYKKTQFNPVKEVVDQEDFVKIPFLTKKDLLNVKPDKRLYVPEEEVDYILTTKGSTGDEPLVTYFRHNYLDYDLEYTYNGPYSPLIPKDIKKIFFLRRAERVPMFVLRMRHAEKLPIFGNRSNLEWSAKVLRDTQAEGLIAIATDAISISSYINKYYNLKKIRYIQCYGQPITKLQRGALFHLYPKASIICIYGLGEVGSVGLQCPHLAKSSFNIYHARDNFIYEEIKLTNRPLKELVITSLIEAATPMIRYRTGDAVEFINHNYQCKCGRNGLIFNILGRIRRDTVQLSGIFFMRHQIIKETLLRHNIKYTYFRMEVSEKKVKGVTLPRLKLILFTDEILTKKSKDNMANLIIQTMCLEIGYEIKENSKLFPYSISHLIKNNIICDFLLETEKVGYAILIDEIIDKRISYAVPASFYNK
jgi:phenylacetate-coenzyme A ligase PaaK-like adenylate-forming protein